MQNIFGVWGKVPTFATALREQRRSPNREILED